MKREEFGLELSSKAIGHLHEYSSNSQNLGFYHQKKGNFTMQWAVKKIMIMIWTRKVLLKSVGNKDGIYAL